MKCLYSSQEQHFNYSHHSLQESLFPSHKPPKYNVIKGKWGDKKKRMTKVKKKRERERKTSVKARDANFYCLVIVLNKCDIFRCQQIN